MNILISVPIFELSIVPFTYSIMNKSLVINKSGSESNSSKSHTYQYET